MNSGRPHVWRNGVCVWCCMRTSWEGARYACSGGGVTGLTAEERAAREVGEADMAGLFARVHALRSTRLTHHAIAKRLRISRALVIHVLRNPGAQRGVS